MPLKTDPDHKVEIVLDSDAGKDNPPTFVFSTPTMRDELRLGEVYDSHTPKDVFDTVTAALAPLLVGWRNMGNHQFVDQQESKVNALGDLLNMTEGMEIVAKLLAHGRLTDEEKKRQDSAG